ncbi:hypothetical protein KDW39_16490 [Burkholderia multivorans]|nr:hypothetical protein [Burkholderia multivorans]
MDDLFGMPQPLTGDELVTIHQMQNGVMVRCSMRLSTLQGMMTPDWAKSLPTQEPTTAGIVWNNAGVVSIS